MTVSVLCLFLTVPWVGLQCVIVAFPGHTHLLLETRGIDGLILKAPSTTVADDKFCDIISIFENILEDSLEIACLICYF